MCLPKGSSSCYDRQHAVYSEDEGPGQAGWSSEPAARPGHWEDQAIKKGTGSGKGRPESGSSHIFASTLGSEATANSLLSPAGPY